jgi:hypothetical protein
VARLIGADNLPIIKKTVCNLANGFFNKEISPRLIESYPPQTLPELHEGVELAPSENELEPAAGLEANVDIFFFTLLPPQEGQTTSSILLRLKTRSSKDSSHSVQTNSKIGMATPVLNNCEIFDQS